MVFKGRLGLATARVPQKDRHGLVWLGRGRLFVEEGCLSFVTAGTDELEVGTYQIPFQTLSCIMLGPGATVSHDALRLLARHGTGLVAVGEGGVRCYASMPFGPDDSKLARRQARLWSESERRVEVIRAMYRMRFDEIPAFATDLNALRGIEGARMKTLYQRLAERHRVNWKGRRYDRQSPDKTDAPNMAINHAAKAVQAAAMVAVSVCGAIPQLGFIHESSGIAFCLDIADLHRATVTLPVAFEAVSKRRQHEPLERVVRRKAGETLIREKVVPTMIDQIKELLSHVNDDDDHHA